MSYSPPMPSIETSSTDCVVAVQSSTTTVSHSIVLEDVVDSMASMTFSASSSTQIFDTNESPADTSASYSSAVIASADADTVNPTFSKYPKAFSIAEIVESLSRLPSYEEAIERQDVARLPSYLISRRERFHPYRQKVPLLVDGVGIDRLFNTIYDEEHVRIRVPPAPERPLPTPPLVATFPLVNPDDTHHIEYPDDGFADLDIPQDMDEIDRRMRQNVAAVILQEFVAGLVRAQEA